MPKSKTKGSRHPAAIVDTDIIENRVIFVKVFNILL